MNPLINLVTLSVFFYVIFIKKTAGIFQLYFAGAESWYYKLEIPIAMKIRFIKEIVNYRHMYVNYSRRKTSNKGSTI